MYKQTLKEPFPSHWLRK